MVVFVVRADSEANACPVQRRNIEMTLRLSPQRRHVHYIALDEQIEGLLVEAQDA